MNYLILTIILFLLQNIYIIFAKKYNVVDNPTSRSSHKLITIRGGGIIIPISLLIYFIITDFSYLYFFMGLSLISIVSFYDDLSDIKQLYRLSIHLIVTVLILYQFSFFAISFWLSIVTIILILGWLNAFNFMDGINGISSLYTLINLMTFYFINSKESFIDNEFIIFFLVPILVFSFYNVRNNAVVFAGDVGSMSLSYTLAFLMITLILYTENFVYILFFSLYGIDTVITIFQRLIKKENIFKAHRLHLFQLLVNEKKWSHLLVSSLYAFIQLIINIIIIFFVSSSPYALFIALCFLLVLALFYSLIKYNILNSINYK